MSKKRYLRMISVAAIAVCSSNTAAVRADAPSATAKACMAIWNAKLQPIADSYCVACHQTASPAGGLSLQRGAAPASLLGVPSTGAKLARVEPGEPAKSYLFYKIMGTQAHVGGSGDRMPLGGELTEAEIAVFEKWITDCRPSAP
jgi:hypothetical protein